MDELPLKFEMFERFSTAKKWLLNFGFSLAELHALFYVDTIYHGNPLHDHFCSTGNIPACVLRKMILGGAQLHSENGTATHGQN